MIKKKIKLKLLNFDDVLKESLKDKEFKKAYDDLEPEFAIIDAIIKKRIKDNLTQGELAKRLKTKQPVISRLESGTLNPSLKFLKRVAKALDAKLYISIR